MQRKDTWAYLDRISNDGLITEWMLPNRVTAGPARLTPSPRARSSPPPSSSLLASRLRNKKPTSPACLTRHAPPPPYFRSLASPSSSRSSSPSTIPQADLTLDFLAACSSPTPVSASRHGRRRQPRGRVQPPPPRGGRRREAPAGPGSGSRGRQVLRRRGPGRDGRAGRGPHRRRRPAGELELGDPLLPRPQRRVLQQRP
jgi:hypothetical protein